MSHRLTARDILSDLDHDARSEPAFFPDFGHGYVYHVDARLTAYGDGTRWAIVIEQLGVNPRVMGGGMHTTLYYHGNCVQLARQPGWSEHDVQTISIIRDGPSGPLMTEPRIDQINLTAKDVRIRDQVVPIRTDSNYYWARNIDVHVLTNEQIDEWIEQVRRFLPAAMAEQKVPHLEGERARVGKFELRTWHLLRGLVPEHRELLLATDAERRLGIPDGLPQLVQLDDWDHPRLIERELPSGSDAFKFVARVLAGADASKLEWPTERNVHWTNWPTSGSM